MNIEELLSKNGIKRLQQLNDLLINNYIFL